MGEIRKNLARMWADTAKSGGAAPAPEDARAMQMNFVLHFGFATQVDDALVQFETIKQFAHRYPSRVVVLCPLSKDNGANQMRAKVYGECFLGKTKGDTRCVEFVMLSYPLSLRCYLESQASTCFSTDLPLYYWAHRFSDSSRLADYRFLLKNAKRVIFDTAIVPADARTYSWPRMDTIRDLVHSRLLPVRQSIGQFLSGFEPAKLVDGLDAVKLYYRAGFEPEARVLMGWIQRRLRKCGLTQHTTDVIKHTESTRIDDFAVEFCYEQNHYFKWRADLGKSHAEFAADYGGGKVELVTPVRLLEPAAALSEAVFF